MLPRRADEGFRRREHHDSATRSMSCIASEQTESLETARRLNPEGCGSIDISFSMSRDGRIQADHRAGDDGQCGVYPLSEHHAQCAAGLRPGAPAAARWCSGPGGAAKGHPFSSARISHATAGQVRRGRRCPARNRTTRNDRRARSQHGAKARTATQFGARGPIARPEIWTRIPDADLWGARAEAH